MECERMHREASPVLATVVKKNSNQRLNQIALIKSAYSHKETEIHIIYIHCFSKQNFSDNIFKGTIR